jgi:mannose-6-phosphate isomerase-like protein (cupin superfamily)
MDTSEKLILRELFPAEPDCEKLAVATPTAAPNPVDHWTPAVLLERGAVLAKMAKFGDGSASDTLKEYPQHCAMLSFRSRDGAAEVHEDFADVFYVLEGRAAMLTGGNVTSAKIVSPGETRGAAIEGGKRQELRAGDVVHVPAGVPHQMLVTAGKTITCLVMKIQDMKIQEK